MIDLRHGAEAESMSLVCMNTKKTSNITNRIVQNATNSTFTGHTDNQGGSRQPCPLGSPRVSPPLS